MRIGHLLTDVTHQNGRSHVLLGLPRATNIQSVQASCFSLSCVRCQPLLLSFSSIVRTLCPAAPLGHIVRGRLLVLDAAERALDIVEFAQQRLVIPHRTTSGVRLLPRLMRDERHVIVDNGDRVEIWRIADARLVWASQGNDPAEVVDFSAYDFIAKDSCLVMMDLTSTLILSCGW